MRRQLTYIPANPEDQQYSVAGGSHVTNGIDLNLGVAMEANGSPPAPRAATEVDPAQQLHRIALRALRGRGLLAIGLGLLCAVAGTYVGWKLGKPVYRS